MEAAHELMVAEAEEPFLSSHEIPFAGRYFRTKKRADDFRHGFRVARRMRVQVYIRYVSHASV